jgi:hypothetical protein
MRSPLLNGHGISVAANPFRSKGFQNNGVFSESTLLD